MVSSKKATTVLYGCYRVAEYDPAAVWCGVGNAAMGERYVGELRGQKGNRMLIPIWRMTSLCLMWCVWRERNAHSFKDCEIGLINLKKLVIQTLFMWRVKLQSMSECSYSDF
jgi:hypothetical protein